jgi:hypothetical protein
MGRRKKSELAADSFQYTNKLQRTAANNRERTRMRILSKAFSRLKTALPWVPNDTKLSKLDTLKLASSYIAHLTKILNQNSTTTMTTSATTNLKMTYSQNNSQIVIDAMDSFSNCSSLILN